MSRNPNEILTWSGISLDPFAAVPEQIVIADIAHSLALICRANGHIDHFYSVAQHSLHCAEEARARGRGERVALYCLLHDAAECYFSDLIRPIKRRFPSYGEGEQRLWRVILEALSLDPPTAEEQEAIEAIDDCLLYHEFLNLRGVRVFEQAPPIFATICYDFVQPCAVEAAFLACYHKLSGR